jgi:hypothetical protein
MIEAGFLPGSRTTGSPPKRPRLNFTRVSSQSVARKDLDPSWPHRDNLHATDLQLLFQCLSLERGVPEVDGIVESLVQSVVKMRLKSKRRRE